MCRIERETGELSYRSRVQTIGDADGHSTCAHDAIVRHRLNLRASAEGGVAHLDQHSEDRTQEHNEGTCPGRREHRNTCHPNRDDARQERPAEDANGSAHAQ